METAAITRSSSHPAHPRESPGDVGCQAGDRAVGAHVGRTPGTVGQLPGECVLGGPAYPRVVSARPELAEKMDLPQRALVLLVVLRGRRPRTVLELRVEDRGDRRVRVAVLPQRRSRGVVGLAQERAAREDGDCGVVRFEQPADRLGGDLGQDACFRVGHAAHLPRGVYPAGIRRRASRPAPRRRPRVRAASPWETAGSPGHSARTSSSISVQPATTPCAPRSRSLAMTARYSARDSSETTPRTSSR